MTSLFRRKKIFHKFKQPRRLFRFSRKILIGGGLISIFLIIFNLIASFLIVKKVLITNQGECLSQSDIQKITVSLKLHRSILSVDPQKVRQSLLRDFICLGEVSLRKKMPSTILINARARIGIMRVDSLLSGQPLNKNVEIQKKYEEFPEVKQLEATMGAKPVEILDFDLKEASVAGRFIVDSAGVVFAKSQENDSLPKVSAFMDNLDIGRTINLKIIHDTLAIFKKLSEMSLKNQSAQIVNEKYLLLLIEQTEKKQQPLKLTFILNGDHLKQLASLQLILTKSRIELKSIDSIDLRFDKPVVIYGKR